MNAVSHDHDALDVDIGDEPPLMAFDDPTRGMSHRRVSLRWLTGTVLAAMASTSLMGGALYVALDGQETIARPIDQVSRADAGRSGARPADLITKGDLLAARVEAEPTRQILKVSTIMRDGDRDIIRLRPFARVSAPLVTDTAALAGDIPTYDPLRVFAEANVEQNPAPEDVLYGADIESEMAVKISDFPVDSPLLSPVADTPIAETERLVREAARFLDGTNVQLAALPLVDPARFDFGFAERSSFDQFGVRIIPENVSFVAMTDEAAAAGGSSDQEEKIVTAGRSDTFESLLTANEATDEEAAEIALVFKRSFAVVGLERDDRLRITLEPARTSDEADAPDRYRPVRVSLYRNDGHAGTVALSDKSGYVASEERPDDDMNFADTAVDSDDGQRPRLYESLYQTALANEMSPEMIDELVRIYSFDMDFNARVKPGDSIEVVYSLDEDGTESAEASDIIYTAITLSGKTRRFYRYKAPDDGSVDYYDEDGKSAKKFLMRKPMTGGTFRSGFGSRRHPLLGYVRAHTGVDWAAPRGTPIMAAGDGEVVYADWKSGYGNYIEIRHTNGYETAYAHQTGFAKGIRKGARVRQGQVIGYVGSTGLSTGPHLHYEVHVNGTPVDPMRIKLPRGRSLEGDILAAFQAERVRTETLLGGHSPAKFAAAGSGSGG